MSKERTDLIIRNYMDGRMETGLLLIGGQPAKMMGDAIKVASFVLSVDVSGVFIHPDFIMITQPEGKQSIGVDDVVPILNKSQLQPAVSDRQVAVIDNFEIMTKEAQNKLLKTVEESELLIIALAYSDKVLPTIKSRMQIVQYEPMSKYSYKELKGKDYSLAEYYLSGGDPDAELDNELVNIFNRAGEVIRDDKASELFKLLGLVKEKNNSSFYIVNRDAISKLSLYMGSVLAELGNSDMAKLCVKNMENCTLQSYTENDFFVFIADIVEGG